MIVKMAFWAYLLLICCSLSNAEHTRELEISEGVSVGTKIGYIGDSSSAESGPPYLIVPVGSAVDSDLQIDQNTGEIRTKVPLDRETKASYSLVAIPMTGDNVKVIVKVLDENDNAPTFPQPVVHIEFPENTPRDVKRTLPPARDLDLDVYNTQRYNIVSGNTNNAFRLSSHRERDGVLYLDLQINGFLDRETCDNYNLVIEALDGGTPPLRGEMTVNITIQDVNDQPPVFNQTRYFASAPENSTVGTTILQVFATDADIGENAEIEYSINRRQSDKDMMFRINMTTGVISVNKPLDFEAKELHELVVVAKDRGLQPLEATAFVSIKVIDVNDNLPTINVIFLSDDASPKISEASQVGEFVARISVHDPDSKTDYSNVNVTLTGGDGHFGLTTRDNIIYLVVVSLPLDRETKPNYTLNIEAMDTGNPPLHASRVINLQVMDVNDNKPEFDREVYEANVMEVSDPGTSVIQLTAHDRDDGNNSLITYTLLELTNQTTASRWFQIDPRTGLVTTRAHVDCETEPVPKLTVIATDNGFPSLSSSAIVLVTIHDVNDNEPIFDQSFYNVSVAEDEAEGRCILKFIACNKDVVNFDRTHIIRVFRHLWSVLFTIVLLFNFICFLIWLIKERYTVSATDPDCGINAVVNYTLGLGFEKLREFKVRSDTGEICIGASLDYETRNVYEFPVIATDRGGLSTTAIVKIQITDVNDNRPTFYPSQYNVSLRDGGASASATTPVVIVSATDPDSGKFGSVTYRIVSGNDAGLFRIDRSSGEIFVTRPNHLSTRNQPNHRLNISATDGGNLKSFKDAEVFISVIDSTQKPPIFEQPRYAFSVMENVRIDNIVGHVKATVVDNAYSNVKYSIYSGDPDQYFRIDSVTGAIKVASQLDRETRSSVLLNVQATSGNPPVYGHTQVNIDIDDINDNPPEFESQTVRISVPENADTGVAFYAAHASDKDFGSNGIIKYKLSFPSDGLFKIDPKSGHLTLSRHLDYETSHRHTIVITAVDMGIPPLSANLTVLVEVQDVNDNSPIFEKNEYNFSVSESLAVNSQIIQFTAVDADTGNNARITYRLQPSNFSSPKFEEVFGIFPNSGWLYLKENLDRETVDHYSLVVSARDNGTPSLTATSKVNIEVVDANDNSPIFHRDSYEFQIEENLARGTFVGKVWARDEDSGPNASLRYILIPGNSSFQINAITGEITTKEILDRETKSHYNLLAEARDQGSPPRSARIPVKIIVLDVNDNAPEIVDPQEDVVSVREEQSPGTDVVRVRAIDYDNGYNSSVTYSLIKSRDSDDSDAFSIHPITGVIKTKVVLDHDEKIIYRLAVAATDSGNPPKQTVRMIRIEVLDLNDHRPTFTSSSLTFTIPESAKIGDVVGSVSSLDLVEEENLIADSSRNSISYTITSDGGDRAFDIDRNSGKIVVAQELDREKQDTYNLDIRALDTSATNNPQSSAISVKIIVQDVNDNAPKWSKDPETIVVNEKKPVGSIIFNFTAKDEDLGPNSYLKYALVSQFPPLNIFTLDSLTGALILASNLDYETATEHLIVVMATDQALNISERLSNSVTAKVFVTDFNDNAPQFILPHNTMFLDKDITVGMLSCHLLAVDSDSGDNGRVTYILSRTPDAHYFSLGYDTGFLTLAKPLPEDKTSFVLNITAADHGKPTKQTSMELKLLIQDSMEETPKFLDQVYDATISENVPIGSLVTQLNVKGRITQSHENITFVIPSGIGDDAFEVLSPSGKVHTKKLLDRETQDIYVLPIYVTEAANEVTNFDLTKLKIKLSDVNDYFPKFTRGSCYRLSVPENSEPAIIHTVVAKDLDSGNNGLVSYSISSGNIGNKFSMNSKTGELTAKSLDRESHSKYCLTVTAKDHGNPSLQGYCNLTVIVEDQNDSDPKFDLSKYSTSIFEDTIVDTSILKVHALDADVGLNAKIIYYLANESQWLFRIDNHTGVITTAGLFDRERQNEYNFMVVATDSGKYNTRSTKVSVTVYIKDINDNKPIFAKYPFREKIPAYIQPGQAILKVVATDADEGINGDVVFNLVNDLSFGKFRINPNTGIITATQSLASQNEKVLYLNVQATDKGNPSKSSNGLVEIIVGDLPPGSPKLTFHNNTYEVTISENLEKFKDVIQVGAVRTDGRRQKINYIFGTGNEENIFSIDPDTGIIQVNDPKNLDFEVHHEINLVVEAKTEGLPNLHGYCNVKIKLTDQNDNMPKFTQQQYTASVSEEGKKGNFVLQVVASDADQGHNSRVLYHIVDGNHDNAFKIEPAFSGILRTNIVLDREIRDNYRLTVIATDEGIPQMTGTTRIRINVIDVNDNRPTFPPHSTIKVKEDVEIGTVLTTITANDVDTYPELTYSFAKENDPEYLKHFSIDRFSGKIVLKEKLDFESWQEFRMDIIAFDGIFDARTSLTIKVVDCNDNAPLFAQVVYEANLPDVETTSLVDILTVNASDLDSNENSEIHYFIANPTPGVYLGSDDGILKINVSNVSSTGEDIYLTIKAEDMGSPKLYSTAAIRIKVKNRLGGRSSNKKEYKINIPENTSIGKTLIHVAKPNIAQNLASYFKILEGNLGGLFEISPATGALTLVHPLDRETKDRYDLKISVDASSSTLIHVMINVEDVNDNAPIFSDTDYDTSISESLPVDSYVGKVTVTDSDLSGTPNSEIRFDITSGNSNNGFRIDLVTGGIYVNKTLDFDKGDTEYNLIIRACDKGTPALCSLGSFKILLEDENDNTPIFPFAEYIEVVGENEPVGTAVFTAKATDLDKGKFGKVTYSIKNEFEKSFKMFNIDPDSGLVTTGVVFDYEQRNKYEFVIKALDAGGRSSTVKVQVNIEGKDEFSPQFTEKTYRFTLATSYSMPVGYVIGFITATDKDKGADGRVVYQLTTQHSFFKVNRTTGAILIKRKFNDNDFLTLGREVSLVVTASSGRQGSLTNMTVVEILLDPLADPGTNLAINGDQNSTFNAPQNSISDWALGLLISIILLIITFGAVFVFMHMKNKRNRKTKKPNLNTETVSTSNNYVDPSNFDTIPVRGGHQMVGVQNQFAPPKYDEIPVYGSAGHPVPSSNSGAPTSEIAGSEQSGSSGRGSAEEGDDGEDEEIRMINEGPLQRDSGLHRQADDDNLSNRSARNTQEYLARLGIVNTSTAHPQTMTNRHLPDPRATTSKDSLHHHQPLDNLHNMFDDTEVENDNDISNFYAKLSDVAGSDRASSTGEKPSGLGPSIEHVMAIGGYGELPTVGRHQPSMNGSLSSIVHSEEELAGSYNWDYLLDWGPQYQPLAHVFSEIARLKDDTASVHSGASGTSSVGKKSVGVKNVPPPLITGVAPRSIAMPVLNARGGPAIRHGPGGHGQMMLPRSPINHDASGGSFSTSTAMSPSFSPSLSPLATKSPSISPLVAPGLSTAHHVMSRQPPNRQKGVVDTEMRL